MSEGLIQNERLSAEDHADLRWAERLWEEFGELAGDDGTGCESGDPLDVAVAMLQSRVYRLVDRADEAEARAAILRAGFVMVCARIPPEQLAQLPSVQELYETLVADGLRAGTEPKGER